jgi:hypothetical protein
MATTHTFDTINGKYEVTLTDLGKDYQYNYGKNQVEYVLISPNGEVLSHGTEFCPSPMRKNPESRKCALELMAMVSEDMKLSQEKIDFIDNVDNGDLGIEISDSEESEDED